MKAPDPLFQWRIHFWYFHARRGITLWKPKEGKELPRKAGVITEMMIILTMRLAESRDFYGKNGHSSVNEERSN